MRVSGRCARLGCGFAFLAEFVGEVAQLFLQGVLFAQVFVQQMAHFAPRVFKMGVQSGDVFVDVAHVQPAL